MSLVNRAPLISLAGEGRRSVTRFQAVFRFVRGRGIDCADELRGSGGCV